MLDDSLALRYSSALYAIAKKAGEANKQMEDLKLVQALLLEHKRLSEALESPTVPTVVKQNIVRELFAQRVGSRTLHFLYLVIDKRREKYLLSMCRCYENQLKHDQGVIEAKVEVAVALDPQIEALVRTKLVSITGKKVEMKVVIRPELVAGVVITLGDRLYDGSVKNHLDKIRERMSKG